MTVSRPSSTTARTPIDRGPAAQRGGRRRGDRCRHPAMRLPTFRDRYGEIADAAGREQLSYRAFLSELLLAECDDREQRRAGRRVAEAGFPRPKHLADFDFTAKRR